MAEDKEIADWVAKNVILQVDCDIYYEDVVESLTKLIKKREAEAYKKAEVMGEVNLFSFNRGGYDG